MHTVKIVAEIVGGIVVVGILLIVLFGYEVTKDGQNPFE
jgi:hypothetical protein